MKMRGVTDFRVKGEKIGQPEVIFRKIIFSVTAKHAKKGENDFLKSFSPKTNAPLCARIFAFAVGSKAIKEIGNLGLFCGSRGPKS